MPGLTRRRLYKPERTPARKKGVLHSQAPIGCPDASAAEIAMALFSLAACAGVSIGRGGEYCSLRDEYTLIGKPRESMRVQDIRVKGAVVAEAIKKFREERAIEKFIVRQKADEIRQSVLIG